MTEKKIAIKQKEKDLSAMPAYAGQAGHKQDDKKVAKAVSTTVKISATHFVETIGKRKNASARVRFYGAAGGEIIINDKKFKEYFPTLLLQQKVIAPLKRLDLDKTYRITVVVKGGGKQAQAEAVSLGIARGLVKIDPEVRPSLRTSGLLTRDSRKKERKKPGLKRARRAPQWSKR